jgi:hypothetical protein
MLLDQDAPRSGAGWEHVALLAHDAEQDALGGSALMRGGDVGIAEEVLHRAFEAIKASAARAWSSEWTHALDAKGVDDGLFGMGRAPDLPVEDFILVHNNDREPVCN